MLSTLLTLEGQRGPVAHQYHYEVVKLSDCDAVYVSVPGAIPLVSISVMAWLNPDRAAEILAQLDQFHNSIPAGDLARSNEFAYSFKDGRIEYLDLDDNQEAVDFWRMVFAECLPDLGVILPKWVV